MTYLLQKNTPKVYFCVAAFIVAFCVYSIAHADSGVLLNPLDSAVSAIPTLIQRVVRALVLISLPFFSLAIVYSGLKFVAARGNPDALTIARRNFLFVMIGAIVVFGAWVFTSAIVNTAGQIIRA